MGTILLIFLECNHGLVIVTKDEGNIFPRYIGVLVYKNKGKMKIKLTRRVMD
jgi:hypothetical protein